MFTNYIALKGSGWLLIGGLKQIKMGQASGDQYQKISKKLYPIMYSIGFLKKQNTILCMPNFSAKFFSVS
jgi:hypothetical protein